MDLFSDMCKDLVAAWREDWSAAEEVLDAETVDFV